MYNRYFAEMEYSEMDELNNLQRDPFNVLEDFLDYYINDPNYWSQFTNLVKVELLALSTVQNILPDGIKAEIEKTDSDILKKSLNENGHTADTNLMFVTNDQQVNVKNIYGQHEISKNTQKTDPVESEHQKNLSLLASVASQQAKASESKSDSIYERLDTILETAFTRMSTIKNDESKRARETCKIIFDVLFDDHEILQGSLSGRRTINGLQKECKYKKYDEEKILALLRFYAWMCSNPEVRTIRNFENFEAVLMQKHKVGLDDYIHNHISERVLVKHSSTRRKELSLKNN